MKIAPILGSQSSTAEQTASVARSTLKSAKILLAGRLTALAGGGGETSMLALAEALPEVGLSARLWRPWEDSLAEAHCLHLFGTAEEFLPLVEAARRLGVKVILSPLLWAHEDMGEEAPAKRPLRQKVTDWASQVGRVVCPRWPTRQKRLYQSVDLLMPASNAEAQQLIRQFQVPAERVHVVPHGASPRFALADPEVFVRRHGVRDFVLHVGAIEPRNNQIGFLWAMREQDVPLVILGNVVPGYEWYEAQCRRAAGPRVKFVPAPRPDDSLLEAAYAACGCLVVGSGLKAPERFALEAGMSGTPLVLFGGGSADEYFGRQAIYVKEGDLRSLRCGVLEALARRRSPSLAEHVRTYFSWHAVAKATREAYAKVLRPLAVDRTRY